MTYAREICLKTLGVPDRLAPPDGPDAAWTSWTAGQLDKPDTGRTAYRNLLTCNGLWRCTAVSAAFDTKTGY